MESKEGRYLLPFASPAIIASFMRDNHNCCFFLTRDDGEHVLPLHEGRISTIPLWLWLESLTNKTEAHTLNYGYGLKV